MRSLFGKLQEKDRQVLRMGYLFSQKIMSSINGLQPQKLDSERAFRGRGLQSKETFRGGSAVAREVKHLGLEIKKGNAVRKVFQPVFPFATERARFGILKSGFSAPSISNGLQERKVALRWD